MNSKENPFNQPYLENKIHYNQYIMLSKRCHGVMRCHMNKNKFECHIDACYQ
jgi:hypothetical protein